MSISPLHPRSMSVSGNRDDGALIRVMSPTTTISTTNRGILMQQQVCVNCNLIAIEPVVCTGCGIHGHPQCIGLEHVQGFPFCATCTTPAIQDFARQLDAARRQQWTLQLTRQLAEWMNRLTEVVGASTSFGIAVGGATAAATGAAVGLVSGVMQGLANHPALPRDSTDPL